MKELTVVKVSGRREMNDFLSVPDIIYAGCAQYVPDMRSDVRAMFVPKADTDGNAPKIQPFVAYAIFDKCAVNDDRVFIVVLF